MMQTMIEQSPYAIARGERRRRSSYVRTIAALPLLLVLAASICRSQAASPSPPGAAKVQNFYESGIAMVKSGHIDEGIASFEKGLEIAPSDKLLLNATGAAYSIKGELETARAYFVRSLDVDTGFTPARQNLGITLFSLGSYTEAGNQFKTLATQAGPNQPIARFFLGMIAEKQSDCMTAVDLMKDAGSLLTQYPDAALAYAECAYQVGDYATAEQTLAAFSRSNTASSAERERAADLSKRLNQGQRSHPLMDADRSNETRIELEKKRADLLKRSGRLEEAQEVLENLTASRPTPDLLIDLARLAKERGDISVAMKALKKASEVDPDREESYLEFSTICSDHGSDALALETADIGLLHVPNSYRLTVQKGVVLEKLGHLGDAETVLRTAVGMEKDNSIAMLSLAVVLAHGGKVGDAEQTLAEAIRRFPDNYYMYYFQGKLLLQFDSSTSDPEHLKALAQRSLEESIRLNPDYADSYYQLSDLYMASSPKSAEAALQRCLKLDPNHIPAQYSLARLYLRSGRKTEGQALFAKLKTQQRREELEQQKQLRIEVAQK
jgi:tetratricopeptide (TPR) repeat protein